MNVVETADLLHNMQQAGAPVNTADATVRIWLRALGKYPAPVVAEIVMDYMAKREDAPRPAAIRKLCEDAWERHLREESRKMLTKDPMKMSLAEWHRLHPGKFYELYQAAHREQQGHENANPPSCVYGAGSVIEQVFDRPV